MNKHIACIEDFSFVSRSGMVAEARLGVNVDPYARAEHALLAKVWYEGIVGAAWVADGNKTVKIFDSTVAIYPSPSLHFIVAVLLDPSIFPHNALVLNADGTIRHHLRQPARYAGQNTEFLDAWWYERTSPSLPAPWWAFWRKREEPAKETRMKLLIGWVGDPCQRFEALDFDPETGEFGELVDSGRL